MQLQQMTMHLFLLCVYYSECNFAGHTSAIWQVYKGLNSLGGGSVLWLCVLMMWCQDSTAIPKSILNYNLQGCFFNIFDQYNGNMIHCVPLLSLYWPFVEITILHGAVQNIFWDWHILGLRFEFWTLMVCLFFFLLLIHIISICIISFCNGKNLISF